MRLAIVGGGWAGLSAAVAATDLGYDVTLLEMAPDVGGRARALASRTGGVDGLTLDNGQHILIGAYRNTLAMMARVGVHLEHALIRQPLTLRHAQGHGLVLAPGPVSWTFTQAVWQCHHWPRRERLRLLFTAARWALQGFTCDARLSVDQLAATIPAGIRRDFLDPLCVAALNTPATQASAQVFLRVLRDALFGGPGASDLLLPQWPLSELFPRPALRWLEAHGATIHRRWRVTALRRYGDHWQIQRGNGPPLTANAVILACSAGEAARLSADHDPDWSRLAATLPHEPIITVVLRSHPASGTRLREAMVALQDGPMAPAQFLFDLGRLRKTTPQAQDHFAAVVSGAGPWVTRGLDDTAQAVQNQVQPWLGMTDVIHVCCEKRATLLCTPGLQRPHTALHAPALWAAGDYIDGPYPSTLEGAVLSGLTAVEQLGQPVPAGKMGFRNTKKSTRIE